MSSLVRSLIAFQHLLLKSGSSQFSNTLKKEACVVLSLAHVNLPYFLGSAGRLRNIQVGRFKGVRCGMKKPLG